MGITKTNLSSILISEQRLHYTFSFPQRGSNFTCIKSTSCPQMDAPPQCPPGYNEVRENSTCGLYCRDIVGYTWRCPCNDWMSCAVKERYLWGCYSGYYSSFRVRECSQGWFVMCYRPTDQTNLRLTNQPSDWPINPPTDQPTDWPTNPLTDHPTHRLTHRLSVRPTHRLTNPPTDRPTDWPTHRLTNPPTDQPTDCPSVRPTHRLTNRSNPPTDRPTHRLTVQPTDWLSNPLANWQASWWTNRLTDQHTTSRRNNQPIHWLTDKPADGPPDWMTNKLTGQSIYKRPYRQSCVTDWQNTFMF
jgi:hypothetical protein